jgi:hypothetical protein
MGLFQAGRLTEPERADTWIGVCRCRSAAIRKYAHLLDDAAFRQIIRYSPEAHR